MDDPHRSLCLVQEINMPKLTVEEVGTFEVPQGKRLVLALGDEAKVDQLHACGGQARCTTCRVQFVSGEPTEMTQAEKEVLELRNLQNVPGLRLSCQINCEADMSVKAISRLAGSGRADAGKRPTDQIEPAAVWGTK
jgi:ferredoxin